MSTDVINNMIASRDAITKQVDKNTALFSLGDQCDHFVVVLNGTVRVELLSSQGQQMLLYRIEAGQSCVMTTSCLLGRSDYFAQAISETPAELVFITQATFNAYLNDSTQFRDFVFHGFHERFTNLLTRTAELTTSTVDQRLAAALIERSNTQKQSEWILLTHEQLAVEIGTAREVVSRRLAAFEKQGYVERQRGSVKICDTDKLRSLLSS